MVRNRVYYLVKPYMPRRLRVALRRWHIRRQLERCSDIWPIDPRSGRPPQNWPGWPDGKRFAFVLTHDVESQWGVDQSLRLAELNASFGFRSSFNFVPEGSYRVPDAVRSALVDKGFEVGVHDLRHDGKLYASRPAFLRNAERINIYLKKWGASGFRSALMLHRLEWLHALDIRYDLSSFDTDPNEPQPDGVGTIFPFWVPAPADKSQSNNRPGYVELPYTLPQDSSLFLFIGQTNIDVWTRKLDWIAQQGGMALLNVHPDYIHFDGSKSPANASNAYPVDLYRSFLSYVRDRYGDSAWCALPKDVSQYVSNAYSGRGPRRSLRIGMVSYSFFERDNRVQRYANALAERGDRVDVLSLADPDLAKNPPPKDAPVQVHHLQTRLKNERHIFDFLFRILTFSVRAFRHLNKLDHLGKFDLIHVHNVPDFLVFTTWLQRRKGTRVILDLHDLLPEFFASKFSKDADSLAFKALSQVERLSCRFAHHVIVSNHLWLEKVVQRSADPQRASAYVNHVDEKAFAATGTPHRNGRPARIGIFPGGLYHHQGLHVAVRALPLVLKKHPETQLWIVGDGPAKPQLQQLAADQGVAESIRFMPPVPLRQVPSLLATADFGIVPKLADGFGNEAYSTKIMEFMASGLPVIASRTKIDQYYFPEDHIHFFTAGEPTDMARAMCEVIENSSLRERLIRLGSAYAQRESWSQKSASYFALVDQLVNGG